MGDQKPTDEWPGLGAAQPDWMHFYTLELMKHAGANFVRWGHCATGPASITAGDRLGLIADQPGVDGESDTRGAAWVIRAAAFRDTIIYYRNHPSILIWEGGNQKVTRAHAQELRGYMDQYDPQGGRAYAHRRADPVTAEFMQVGMGTEGGREIARLPKEAYFVCQTMFRPDPHVHIIGHWSYPPGTKKTVYVSSNVGDVELFVNGNSLGRGQVSDRYLFAFSNVVWAAGEIKAVAYADNKAVATEVKRTVGAPVALRLSPITGPGGLRADGSDIALIDVEAVDAQGQRCPTFQQRIDFDIAGPGVWRGGYNSGKTNSINHPYLDLECGVNRIAVRAARTPGAITIRARGEGLRSGSIILQSVALPMKDGFPARLPALPTVNLSQARILITAAIDVAPPVRTNAPSTIQTGRFIKTFSYSGPAAAVHLAQDAQDGKKIFVDRDDLFTRLPAELQGADYVQAAGTDRFYNAVDLMELTVKAGSVVLVAHDDRLPRPDWLTRQFKSTDLSVVIEARPMKVFQRRAGRDESLTLGANTEKSGVNQCNMYIVFVNAVPGAP